MKKFFLLFLFACIPVMAASQPIGTYTVKWVRGPMGRIEQIIENNQKITNFLYDKCGRLATKIKPDGVQLHREYDCLGRITRYYSDDFDYIYTYDLNDQLLSVTDTLSCQTTNRQYDSLGCTLEETLATHFTFKNTFDCHRRRVGMTLPDGSQVTYVFSGFFLYSVLRDDLTYTYAERNLDGRITRIDLPTDLGSIYIDWDPCGRWKKITSPYFSAAYTEYDPVGNLCAYTFEDSLGKKTCYYEYDALDQLIAENDHSYIYDSLYNRRQKDDNPYSINNLHQVASDGYHTFSYDPNGNLLSDGKYQFTYDSQDRLIEICRGNKKIVYAYDPFHRRLTKTVFQGNRGIEKKFYLWDGDNEIGMCDKDGKIEELRILGEGLGAEIGSAVLCELKGKNYVPIHDHRGCIVTLVETKKKQAAETYRYTAFGEELTCGKLSPWRFASKRVEEETGLIYFGRRYYSPTLGRWISPDPQGYDSGYNLYAYLFNSPLTDYDLYGLWSMREAWGSAQHFMWGICEGSAYHFSNMASSFCMRDFSRPGWQPRSLLTNQDLKMPKGGLDQVEKAFLPFTYEARRLGSDASQYDQMRARGRAFGEQAITFGGLFSAFSAGKSLLNSGMRFQEAAQFSAQQLSRDYLFSGKPTLAESSQSLIGTRNRFKPDSRAEGAHSVFRRDPVTGRVTHYETFRLQTNPYDPKPWETVKRFDSSIHFHSHFNKYFDKWIDTPHIHDPYCPGGVRFPEPWEIPHGK